MTPIEILARIDRSRLSMIVKDFAEIHNLAIWIRDLEGASIVELCAYQEHQRLCEPLMIKSFQAFLSAGLENLTLQLPHKAYLFNSFYDHIIVRSILPLYYDDILYATLHILRLTDLKPIRVLADDEKSIHDLEFEILRHQDLDSAGHDTQFMMLGKFISLVITSIFQNEVEKTRQSVQIRDLKSQHARLCEFYLEISESILLTSPDLDILDCNQACLDLLGYVSREELIGLNLLTDLVLDPHRQESIQELMLQHGTVDNFRVELTRKDGHSTIAWISGGARAEEAPERPLWRFFLRSASASEAPLSFEAIDFEETDKTAELVVRTIPSSDWIGRNQNDLDKNYQVSEFVNYEVILKALENTLEEYREVLDNFPQVIFGYNDENKIKYWNRCAEKVLGYTLDEIIDKPVADLISDSSDQQKTEKLLNYSGTHSASENVRVRKSTGSLIQMEIQRLPIALEGQELGLVIAQDKGEIERLRNLIEYTSSKLYNLQLVIDDVVLIIDTYGFISEVNSQAPNMFGYLEPELLGEKLTEFTAFEYREKVELAIQLALKTSEVQRLKTIFITASQKVIPIQMNLCSLRGKGNVPIGMVVLIQDHSKIDTLQKKLTLIQERLNQITHTTGYGIFRYSLTQNQVIEMNPAGLSVLGFNSLEDLNNFPLPKLLTGSSRLDELKKLASEKKDLSDFKVNVARQDGRIISVCLNLRYRAFSDLDAYYEGTFQEMQPLRSGEFQAQDLEQKLLLFAKNFPGGVAVLNVQERIEPLNDQFGEIFGRTQAEVKKLKPERLINKSDRERVMGHWRNMLGRQEFSGYHEFIGLRKGGQHILLGCTTSLAIQKGKVLGLYIILQEITRAKELEKKMAQSDRLETVSSLAAGFAHDFNNLLTEIAGYASVLLIENELNARQREHVLQIQRLSGWAGKLTQQLLAFQKDVKPAHRPFQLNHLIQEVMVMLRHSFEPFIKIVEDLDSNLKIIKGDSTQLQQVLLNVCINAREAMPNGGELRIKTLNSIIKSDEIKSHPGLDTGQYVLVQISDTGVGMSRSVQEKIFEPFFTTKKNGTGLGLYTSYGIIKNHNGVIEVTSELDKGTSFYFYLPAVDEIAPEYRRRIEDIRGGHETIMLIDDEENILDLGSRMLKKYGYQVVLALGARQAIKTFEKKQEKIDLVVLDIVMQGMDGRECAQELSKINPNVTILFTSGFRADPTVREILTQVKGDFLQKPFNMQTFLIKVRDILDRKSHGQDANE